MITQEYVNQIAYEVVGSAIEVHKHLGPGLLESVYEACLIEELCYHQLKVKSQVIVPIKYKERDLNISLKIDLLVEELVIIELKAVEVMIPVFKAQLLSYLKLTGMPKGLLINFNSVNITEQLVPMVTQSFANLPKS